MADHFTQARVWAKEVFTNIVAIFDGVSLKFAVDRRVHFVQQCTRGVARQKFIPLRAPNYFDYVPASTAESRFEFLDNFAVAAHWTVKSLQVAVDDEHQIIEVFARGERNRAKSLWLVAFAITEKRPHSTR